MISAKIRTSKLMLQLARIHVISAKIGAAEFKTSIFAA